MPTEMTLEAAMIELNRLKTTERMDIDRDRMTAAINTLFATAHFRIKKKPDNDGYHEPFCCITCNGIVFEEQAFCPSCGQALDWSSL